MDPSAVLALYDALSSEHLPEFRKVLKPSEDFAYLSLREPVARFKAHTLEHLVGMVVMMLVIMLVLIVIMMVFAFVVIVIMSVIVVMMFVIIDDIKDRKWQRDCFQIRFGSGSGFIEVFITPWNTRKT